MSNITREQKLEEALKSALRMRRGMKDIAPIFGMVLAPRALVEDFDRKMAELSERKQDGSE